jgi:TonB family protein
MRCELALALLPLLASSLAVTQQAASPTPSSAPNSQPAPAVAYYAGPGVTAPELLPPDATIAESIAPIKHCKKIDGTSVLSAIVDSDGFPQEIYFLRAIGSHLDAIALKLAESDRFKPGTRDSAPAAMVVSIEIDLTGCIEKKKKEPAQEDYSPKLSSLPVQRIDLQQPPFKDATLTLTSSVLQRAGNSSSKSSQVVGGITAPVPLITPEARYSDAARKKKLQGICLIRLIVDTQGLPQDVHVIKSLEPGLDQNALDAVNQYLFKPAMLDGHPIPVAIKVEVNFKLY